MFGLSAFWLLLALTFFFADGGFAIVGPYAAEVCPSHLRTTGMGPAYGGAGPSLAAISKFIQFTPQRWPSRSSKLRPYMKS